MTPARASTLAREAGEIAKAHGIKSAYLRLDAEDFLKNFAVARAAQKVAITRKGQEPIEVKLAALKKFVAGGEPEVAKALRGVCGDTRLYPKKLAVLCLARLAQEEASNA
jgi:hypothetical protein